MDIAELKWLCYKDSRTFMNTGMDCNGTNRFSQSVGQPVSQSINQSIIQSVDEAYTDKHASTYIIIFDMCVAKMFDMYGINMC